MATKIIRGKDLLLSVDGVAIGCATSNTLSVETEMIDAACKETGGFYDAEPGTHTATLSADGIVKVDTPADPNSVRARDLLTLQLERTSIDFLFGTTTEGEESIAGKAYITSYEETGENDGNATYSVSLQVVGPFGPIANPAAV